MSRTRNLTIAVAAALAALPAAAQVAAQEADSLETVIVTGTRVTDRTVAESAAPIDIITPEALEATGTGELATALSRVLPSLNFPRPAVSDGTDAVKPAQLRGLAPDQVLVLVNGKRRHTTALINLNDSQGRGSSPVDLNAIPIASIARVEVLRDGASAQYGSDAIAGVVNIVLKGSGNGGGLTARYGQHSAGDGGQYLLSGDAGFDLGERGFLHLAGQGGHNDQTDRARPYIGAPGPAAPPYDRVVQRYGDPEIDQGAVSYNGEFGLGERATLYAFGAASNRDVLSNGFFRPAGDPRNIPAIYPNGFLPNINNVAKDRSTVAGLRGGLGNGWNYDLSYNYGYNKLSFDIRNTLNRSLGPTSPRQFYAGSLEVTQNVANLDFSRPIEAGWLKYPITFAFGAEWREEKFNQSPGELGSYVDGDGPVNTPPGAQVFPGFKPEDSGHHDRNSSSLYADLDADLTDRFSAAVAARHEDYSDFGTTTSGKVSARYAFTDAVALRGTVSSGFRAPSLQQQYFQSTATNFIGGAPFDVRTFAVDNSTAIALGAEPLKAEESKNYGLGLVLSPLDGLYVTVDAYRIDIDDRIVLSENLIGATVTAFLQARGIFGVTGGRYFTNAIDTKTTGVDIVGTYKWVLSSSEVDWTIGYNYSKTTIEKIAPNPPELTAGGLNLQRIGRVEQGRVTVGAPRDKILLGSVWKTGDWSFSGTATRYGKFSALNANPALDQTFGAKWTVDLAAAYQLDAWSFALGADNVFDAYPDEFNFATSNGGQLAYPRNAPFGFNGAFVYGKVGYRWE